MVTGKKANGGRYRLLQLALDKTKKRRRDSILGLHQMVGATWCLQGCNVRCHGGIAVMCVKSAEVALDTCCIGGSNEGLICNLIHLSASFIDHAVQRALVYHGALFM